MVLLTGSASDWFSVQETISKCLNQTQWFSIDSRFKRNRS